MRDRCPPGHGVAADPARTIAARAARALAAACLALLAGCGGGVFLGVGIGDFGDQPPAVALTSSLSEAPAGATVRLVAAASDDFGVDSVAFYREEAAGPPTLLVSDPRAPYQVDTVIPASPAGTVWRYFARAFDGAGQHSDSPAVEITVR
jgi:Big-like domain-containing protein